MSVTSLGTHCVYSQSLRSSQSDNGMKKTNLARELSCRPHVLMERNRRIELYHQWIAKEQELRMKMEKASKIIDKTKIRSPSIERIKRLSIDEGNRLHSPDQSPRLRRQSQRPRLQLQRLSVDAQEENRDDHSSLSPLCLSPGIRRRSCPIFPGELADGIIAAGQSPAISRRQSSEPSYATVRSLNAKLRAERRKASLKSLEDDCLRVQAVLAKAKSLSPTHVDNNDNDNNDNTSESDREAEDTIEELMTVEELRKKFESISL